MKKAFCYLASFCVMGFGAAFAQSDTGIQAEVAPGHVVTFMPTKPLTWRARQRLNNPLFGLKGEALFRTKALLNGTFEAASAADLSAKFTSLPRYQGQRGTCVTFAIVGWVEFHNPGRDFSEQCLAKIGRGLDGSNLQSMGWSYLRRGLVEESTCPYYNNRSEENIVPFSEWSDLCDNDHRGSHTERAVCRSHGDNYDQFTTAHNRVDWTTVSQYDDPLGEIRHKIGNRSEPVLITYWNDMRYFDGVSFRLENRGGGGTDIDTNRGHAVLLVGYDDRSRLLKFRNSWGTALGDKGYMYMSYEYFLRAVNDRLMSIP